ncbi:helix-turn-helix domain-containing protein [Roseibium alexandrii]|uniref:Helix-turn-helix protein n=1 Tax=Roseibium alexandrii (strain DSM 17067 / NCIMB 14079 / DFL-11) TaxID=244592 RepID=A0A5E8H7C1_ROSAD|nr:helix-turn-helix transcriptional regulator [Roseibium alexandrii]EEE48047.1 helix-turn-helix protein [Roseibium alexandrii DFL-11]
MQFQTNAKTTDDKRQELRLQAGAWLKAAREEAGLSQRELAGKMGALYYTFISQIESGKGRLPADRYAVYAEALGVDSREFAIKMLEFYEPTTYQLIFNQKSAI